MKALNLAIILRAKIYAATRWRSTTHNCSLLVDFINSIRIKDEIKIARTFNQISAVFRGKHNSNKH